MRSGLSAQDGSRTEPGGLETWFNRDVVGIFKQHHAFDAEGIFIGDATYLFVPDNPNYENSSLMLFDEDNHPVEASSLTAKQRARCTWRRCYKLVSLIHTNASAEFFLYAGIVVTAGQDHEAPLLYRLVEAFVEHHGRGVMKRLILDRGFLDGLRSDGASKSGESMSSFRRVTTWRSFRMCSVWPKQESYPLSPGSVGFLFEADPLHRPEWIQKREEARQRTLALKKAQAPPKDCPDPSKVRIRSEVAAVSRVETFSNCPIPLNVLVNERPMPTDTSITGCCWIRPHPKPAHTVRNMSCVPRLKNVTGN